MPPPLRAGGYPVTNIRNTSSPLRAILEDPAMRIDGFVGPGHVSMVIGTDPYRFVAEEFHRPIAVAGL